MTKKCDECGRVFNMLDAEDASEWNYGHDCEAPESADEQGDRIRANLAAAEQRGGWRSQADFDDTFEDRDPFEFL